MTLQQRVCAGLYIGMMTAICVGFATPVIAGAMGPQQRQCAAGQVSCCGKCQAKPCAVGCINKPGDANAVDPKDSAVLKDFDSRVNDYMKLEKGLVQTEPSAPTRPTPSAKQIVEAQKELAAKVRGARPNAKQGDIFTPEIAAFFRQQIAAPLAGKHGPKIRASLRHAEPVKPIPLKVDDDYPNGLPLQSTPPTLLLNLPKLPKELDYRIVGHDLVLHDTNANLIVDFIPGAIPAS
jgi:hypothetical protein